MAEMNELPAVGINVHKERLARKLSLDELAKKSGVSKAMLSQIESGKVNPTIMTMWKIAQALQVDFNVLLKGEGEKIRKFQVSRRDDLTRLDTDAAGVHINVLSPLEQAEDLELYLLTLQPDAALKSSPHYAGTEEFLTVLEGELTVTAGRNSATLRPGDVLSYQCDIEHAIANPGPAPARAHLVVRFAKPGA